MLLQSLTLKLPLNVFTLAGVPLAVMVIAVLHMKMVMMMTMMATLLPLKLCSRTLPKQKTMLQAFANIERKKHKFSFGKPFKKAKSIGKKALDVGKKTLQTGLKAYDTYNTLTNPAAAQPGAEYGAQPPALLQEMLNNLEDAQLESQMNVNAQDDDRDLADIEALLLENAQAEDDTEAMHQSFANIERKKHKFSFGKAFKKAKSIGKKALDVGKKTLQTGLKVYNTYNTLTNPAVAPAPPMAETPAELEVLLNALLAKRR